MSAEELLAKTEEWYFGSSELESSIKQFAEQHKDKFKDESSEENKLE
jgi:hypothetical protein